MKVPTTAVYSGTFDPITLGHEHVVQQAAQMFDRVVVAVAAAHHKKTLFSLEERLALAQQAFEHVGNVRVLPFDGLIVNFCKAQNAQVIVRGLRNATDFDYEAQMAAMNQKLAPSIHTAFLLPDPHLQCISATLVREIAKLGGDTQALVNTHVQAALEAKFSSV